MNATMSIARRELDAYFATPVGWLAVLGFVVITGFFFALGVTDFNDQAVQAAYNPYNAGQLNVNEWLLPGLFGNWAVILLFICPAVSMRMFAEDRGQRSFELLLSSPISSAEIVLGKYLGGLGFLTVMFACTLHYVVILNWLGNPDPGILAAAYATMFLLAASFLAVGMLASSFTVNQVVSFVLSFGLLLILWILSWAGAFGEGAFSTVLSEMSMLSHMEQSLKGLLHLKDVLYYLSFIGFFLFATQQRVDAFRWQ